MGALFRLADRARLIRRGRQKPKGFQPKQDAPPGATAQVLARLLSARHVCAVAALRPAATARGPRSGPETIFKCKWRKPGGKRDHPSIGRARRPRAARAQDPTPNPAAETRGLGGRGGPLRLGQHNVLRRLPLQGQRARSDRESACRKRGPGGGARPLLVEGPCCARWVGRGGRGGGQGLMPPRARHNNSSAAVVQPISPAASRWRDSGVLACLRLRRCGVAPIPFGLLGDAAYITTRRGEALFPGCRPCFLFPGCRPCFHGRPCSTAALLPGALLSLLRGGWLLLLLLPAALLPLLPARVGGRGRPWLCACCGHWRRIFLPEPFFAPRPAGPFLLGMLRFPAAGPAARVRGRRAESPVSPGPGFGFRAS